MTEVMEREPRTMMPTIVRRVHKGGIQTLEREVRDTPDGDVRALCIFWSVEHARREMYASGSYPEDGWEAIERDAEALELLFWVMASMGGPTLACVEPPPGADPAASPRTVLRAEDLVAALKECDISAES